MQSDPRALIDIVRYLASAISFLATTPVGLACVGAAILVAFAFRLASALRAAAAAERVSGGRLGPASAIVVVVDTAFQGLLRAASSLPTLLILAVLAVAIVAVSEATVRVEDLAQNAKRIAELSAVVRNLDRSVKVADVRVLGRENGVSRLELDFYDPTKVAGSAERKIVEIRGRDLYFDAIVLNFDYSEIEAGRKVNIAIPYRIFSDEVAQIDGVPLGAADGDGVPYAWKRADDDIYGLAPDVYRARLAELLVLVQNEAKARKAGIVRSVYGSAVHKKVDPGDRLEIRVEQSGGLSVKERFAF